MAVVHCIYEDIHYAVPEEWALNEHPGGADDIFCVRGQDMTDDFDAVGHSRDALNILKSFDTIPIQYKGDEYRINVHWLATDEAMKGDDGHFGAFLKALPGGESATTALIDGTWPEEAKKHMAKHYKVPSPKAAAAVEEKKADVAPTPAAAAAPAAEAPAKKAGGCSGCPCTSPKVLLGLGIAVAALFAVNKYLIAPRK